MIPPNDLIKSWLSVIFVVEKSLKVLLRFYGTKKKDWMLTQNSCSLSLWVGGWVFSGYTYFCVTCLPLCSISRQTTSAANYSKFVGREMTKAEALLKVSDSISVGLLLLESRSYMSSCRHFTGYTIPC